MPHYYKDRIKGSVLQKYAHRAGWIGVFWALGSTAAILSIPRVRDRLTTLSGMNDEWTDEDDEKYKEAVRFNLKRKRDGWVEMCKDNDMPNRDLE